MRLPMCPGFKGIAMSAEPVLSGLVRTYGLRPVTGNSYLPFDSFYFMYLVV